MAFHFKQHFTNFVEWNNCEIMRAFRSISKIIIQRFNLQKLSRILLPLQHLWMNYAENTTTMKNPFAVDVVDANLLI